MFTSHTCTCNAVPAPEGATAACVRSTLSGRGVGYRSPTGITQMRNGKSETMLKSAHQSPGNVCATNDTRVSPVGQGGQVPIKGHPQSRTIRVRSFENLATVGCVQIRVLPHSAVDFAQARKGRCGAGFLSWSPPCGGPWIDTS